ncbi:MAG: DEAD/DEAH box helicase, partial [Actinomycetota bacterium]
APTGSGKTLAFGLPLLARVDRAKPKRPRALVLAPTRELAEQINKDLTPLARAMSRKVAAVYGGVGYGPQLSALRGGVDVLVATPGRLEDLIERGSIDLRQVDLVVVDEADRMADMGFLPAVRRILDQTSRDPQTLLFSATLEGEIGSLSRRYQNDPVPVAAEAKDEAKLDVLHHFWRVERSERVAETARLIEEMGRSIVFTRTRHGADRLVKQLKKAGVAAVSMHGGRSQSQRTRALRDFSRGNSRALVATDVAARGIHVEGVAAVVHYDLAGDHKDYLHRSGRTARAGAAGVVVSLVSNGQDSGVRKLLRGLNLDAPIETPSFERLDTGGHRMGGASSRPTSRSDRGRHNGADSPPKPSNGDSGTRSKRAERSLFVGNLPWSTTGDDLRRLFSDYGNVKRATITTQRKTGRSKGFGFVDILEHSHDGAIEALNGSEFGGRSLRVRPAR